MRDHGRTSGSASDLSLRRADGAAPFDALVRAEYPRLVAFVRRYVKSLETAEDIAQDVFGALWRQETRIDYGDARPYLYRAARNRALSHLRNEQVHERWWRGAAARGEPHAPEQDRDAESAELAAAIARAVDALPEKTRAVFLLSRESGMSYAQIAQTMEIAQKTVEAQMSRAFRMLRSALAPFMEGE